MCGILGVVDTTKQTTKAQVAAMLERLAHRGPDGAGLYADTTAFVGNRRLALLDISDTGAQPMQHEGRYVISYNGEIYNFADVKTKLEALGATFAGNSDTEVLLKAWARWGVAAVEHFRGMFAFVVWDAQQQMLWAVRDRVGVKPLYYWHDAHRCVCASELKALCTHPATPRTLNQSALALYLQLGYVPAPHSVYEGVHKLLPGHYLCYCKGKVTVSPYWQFPVFGAQTQSPVDETALEEKLTEAARLRMVADMPVGVFLSGGVDSSLVTALLAQAGYTDLKTFTIGFDEKRHNEAGHARAVAAHLHTTHYEKTCGVAEAAAIIPRLPTVYDEPFADPSAIPTYLLAEHARCEVTAALSADGGDELFGGYHRYRYILARHRRFGYLPPGLGVVFEGAIRIVAKLGRRGGRPARLLHKLNKAAAYYQARHCLAAMYAVAVSQFTDRELAALLVRPVAATATELFTARAATATATTGAVLQQLDAQTYLPDNILAKVDRASMAVSLEAREPLLDHHLIEYVAALPARLIHKQLGTKYMLRRLLYRYVPRALVERPKQGFGVPLDCWLRGELRHLLDTYLDAVFIKQQGIFNPEMVAKEKQDFLSGAQPYNRVWHLIVFQMWYEQYADVV